MYRAAKIWRNRSPTRSMMRVHIRLLGQGGADLVDQRELAVALARLLDEPRVLERHA